MATPPTARFRRRPPTLPLEAVSGGQFKAPLYAPSSSPAAQFSRRALLRGALGGAVGAAALGGPGAAPAFAAPGPADRVLADDVRQEFLTAWTAYRRLSWGRDELRPVRGTGSDFFIDGVPLGLTLVESLDTLYLMELDGELDAAISWIGTHLDFDRDASVHVFEAIIRMVGGLLSGYHATGNAVLLAKARELADRLLPAFTSSSTGAPYRYVNLRTGAVSGNQVPLAEVGSNITELGWLSQLTGNQKYFTAAKRALKAAYDRRSALDLVGTTLDVNTGAWTDTTARVDPPVDSFFEYLWDAYQFFGDTEIRGWYDTLTSAVLRRLRETYDGRLWFKSVNMNTGAVVGRRQSELTSFYAGLLAQGGNPSQGESYHSSWAAAVTQFRLPPEGIDCTTLTATSTEYQLRPEYADSALFLWLLTGKEVYRDRAKWLWNAQKTHCKVANGYTVVSDMTTTPTTKGDLTPGYWYSENMKYFYLLWAGAPRFDYTTNYLTTEGNVLRGLNRVAAPDVSGTYRLLNRATRHAMDVSSASTRDGAAVIAWTPHGGANQRWIAATTGGHTKLTSLHSGKVLEAPRSAATDGTALIQRAHNGSAGQQWTLRPTGDGYHRLIDRTSGKAADLAGSGNGAAVVQRPVTDATTQQWQLVRA
ncbi:glycoside hydrolase family 47 protein [Streptomyces sp. NPDC058252]|uniref:glycoside hydrolase family 47 protein n=1 Tax=Streptomyces sp. NPDC058252 TaxID=3346405 RepID=UPI0036E07BD7